LRTSNDAAVSIVPPIIPQGEFSSLRLEGWRVRRDLPGASISLSLLPTYTDLRPVCLRPSCFSIDPPKVGSVDAITAPPCGGLLHLPQGPSLRSGLCCPRPSSLSRPHPPHSRAHRDFAALRLIHGALAVRERLGHPRAVPGFHCPFRPGMPSSRTPGSSNVDKFQSSDVDIGLRQKPNGSALPMLPQSASRGHQISRLAQFAHLLRPARLLGALCGSDRSPSQRRLLLPGFQRFGRPSRCWI
jgi:hypothetical protein